MYKKRKYPSLPPLCAHDKLITFAISIKINNIQSEREKRQHYDNEKTQPTIQEPAAYFQKLWAICG